MGISLKSAATFSSQDIFEPWDAALNTFLSAEGQVLRGRLFRADRFTSIYHRPTRRAFVGVQSEEFPSSGTVRRQGTSEIYLLSQTVKTEILHNELIYDRLRMSHLVTPPSGGVAEFYPVTVLGTGDDLGPVSMSSILPSYVDLELQSANTAQENQDVLVSRFLITHSKNINPQSGDYFKFQERWFLVDTPYIDGGLSISKSSELPPGYKTFTYVMHTGTATGYNPVTGVVSPNVVERLFSALVGRNSASGQATTISERSMAIYIYDRHIGFEPKVGDSIKYLGKTYQIDSVILRREDLQWKLEVSF